MQVLSSFRSRASIATIAVAGCVLFSVLAACHRSPSADVVATVNGKEILRAELERIYEASIGDSPQKPSTEETDIRRLNVLHQMIQEEIVDQQAAKLNLTASDEDVNAKLTEIKAPYTDEQFNEMLRQRSQSLDDLKRDIRRGLTETKLMNKEIESKIDITDAQIAAFYAAHKAEFDWIEPQYHLARIVVTTAPQQGNVQGNTQSGEADAKRKIEAALSQLDSGVDFATVAMNVSEDANTASNGGDMGLAPESQLKSDPAVYEAIGKLKPDQFTDVLPVYDSGPEHKIIGYAIYKLISREPAGQRELNDPRVQQAIHQSLHDSQKQLLQTAFLETLTDGAKVRNFLAEQILKRGGQ